MSGCFPLTLKTIQCINCNGINWYIKDKNIVSDCRDKIHEWEIKDDSSTNKCYLIHNPGNICDLKILFVVSNMPCCPGGIKIVDLPTTSVSNEESNDGERNDDDFADSSLQLLKECNDHFKLATKSF